MSGKAYFIKSALWLSLAEVIYNISGYIVHSGAGRILGPADYGRYGLVVTLTTMIIILIGNGIPTAMSKYLSEYFETAPEMIPQVKRQAAIAQAILIGALTVAFFLLAPVTANLLNDETLTPLFRISSLIIPSFAAASFYFYYYIGIHQFKTQAILKIIRSFARVILVLSLAYFFHLKGSIAGYIFAPLAVFIEAWLLDKKTPEQTAQQSIPANKPTFHWKMLLNYAWPITLFMLFYEILISLDLYFVKAMLGSDHLTGIYNGALTVGRIPYYLFYALATLLLPTISKTSAQKDDQKTTFVIRESFRLMLATLFPIIALMIAYARQILEIFYGQNFVEAAASMQVLAVGVGFLTVFFVMSYVLNGAGKVKTPMKIAFGGMLCNAVLNYVFITRYGVIGSAIATTITSVLITLAILLPIHHFFQGLTKFPLLLKIGIATTILYALTMILPAGKYTFLFSSVFVLAIYTATLSLLGVIKKDDWQLLTDLTKKKTP